MNDSIVQIETPWSFGSGIIVGKESKGEENLYYILTAYHIINNHMTEEEKISQNTIPFIITSFNANGENTGINNGTFFIGNEKLDSMILTFLSTRDFVVTKISRNYRLMDEVYSCTCQLSRPPAITKGIISRLEKEFIISDAEISPGSSGGGLFIKHGEEFDLIGIAIGIAIKNGIPIFHCAAYISSKSFLKFLNENKIPIFVQ
jgi:S1-C subfamily serine protease